MSGTRGAPVGAADVLALIIGNQQWIGWQRVAVTRALESIPASFDITVTEKYPTTAEISIRPGDRCQVMIGPDLVITGHVDRYAAAISANDHTVRISGRSKSADLVDCAAFIGDRDNPTFQILGGTALSIAQQLAAPYDVQISSIAGPGADIPTFRINIGETVWEIVDRISRFSKLIAYDLPDGSVQLAQAGSEKQSSGFAQGENVEQASVSFAMDQRYSEYRGELLSTQFLSVDAGLNQPIRGKVARDSGVPRFRLRYIISEQSSMGRFLADDRALWEANRRYGRSQQVNVTCDSWRDRSGKLWSPNHLAPINIPVLKVPQETWLIASVTFARDETGQHALLVLMPVAAFSAEPVGNLSPLPPLVEDVERWNATRRGSE
jgi:prophage tail gpP-like protein